MKPVFGRVFPGVLLLAATTGAPAAPGRDSLQAGVVGLAVTHQGWDEQRPWAKTDPGVRRASGVVVPGPYVLTTSDIVGGATFIQVEKFGRPAQATVRLVRLDAEVGLALLAIDTEGFFSDLRPVELAEATPTDGTLQTVRWQDQQFESAASRVKRFRVAESEYGRLQHLFVEVQTDLQGGGWAEPVFHGQRLTGLTSSQDRDERAKVIPIEIVRTFLERATAAGEYRAFPVFGANWQINKDRALSAFLGQQGEPRGVVIREVPWGTSACSAISPQDILLALDGVEIDAEGFYTHPRFGQILFPQLLVERFAAGDSVAATVLRGGQRLETTMKLRPYPVGVHLIPERRPHAAPPYLIVGGLVFRELDADYLRSWGTDWMVNAPADLKVRYHLEQDGQRPDRRRIVVLSSVLPAEYNIGYQDLSEMIVRELNGITIDGLDDIVGALAHPMNGFHVVAFEPNPSRLELTLDAATLDAATAEILATYDLPAARRLPDTPPPDGGPPCVSTP